MNDLFLIARFYVREGRLEEFKQIASECVSIVKEKEPDTLQYNWYFDESQSECVVLEKYKNSAAALTHMANLGEQLGRLMGMADFKAEVYGEMSEELKKAGEGLDLKVYSYFKGA